MTKAGRLGKLALYLAWIVALAATTTLLAGDEQRDESRAVFAEIDGTLKELEKISGLRLHKTVPSDLISKEKVNEFLKKKVKEVSTPKELRAEELTLKKFGLVPPDFDLAQTTVDVLTEQAAAFYDYHAKRLFITDWTPSSTRDAALAHELAHALADQNFNLKRFINKARENDDGAMARMAVMEGQATWLMSEFLARRSGESLMHNAPLAERMNRMSDSGSGEFPVFDGSPLYIRTTLIFPYTGGMRFQQAVVDKDDKAAFAEVFSRPPISTQQILHPDKYFAAAKPATPDLPEPPAIRGYKGLIGGSFGELDHQVLLELYLGKQAAEDIAPHWRGGQYEILENTKKQRAILLYASRWENAESARKFFEAYGKVMAGKWKTMVVGTKSGDTLKGRGDDGDFVLHVEDTVVTSIEGLEPK
jgi:hypothetical protein